MKLPSSRLVSNRYVADGMLLIVAFIWGTTFALVKEAIENIDVFTFLGQRFLSGGLILLGISCFRMSGLNSKVLRQGVILGLFLFGAFAFQTVGLKFTSASNTAFITGLNVVFVPFCELLMFRRKVAFHIWVGVVLAVSGLFFLTTRGKMNINFGDIIVLGCAICIAFQVLLTDLYTQSSDVLWLTAVELLTVGLVSSAVAFFKGEILLHYYPGTLRALVVCVLFATVIAFLVQTYVQRYTTPSHVAIMFCMEPVFAAVFAYFYSGERLGYWGIVGAGLMFAAMLVSELGLDWLPSAKRLLEIPLSSVKIEKISRD